MSPPGVNKHAGFVLTGGGSTRMGRDKALLPVNGRTLVEQIAARVREAAGNVTVIGPPAKYAGLGLPVAADLVEGVGPLGGVYTALRITSADWNLIVACDMPRLNADFLKALLAAAESAGRDCLVPSTDGGLEPLCAVYHRRVLPAAKRAIDQKLLKLQDFVRGLDHCKWPVEDRAAMQNVNTPEEWLEDREGL